MLNLSCVICAELFSHSDDVHITPCGHLFHFVCLKQWLERSKSCPQCRNKCSDRSTIRVYFNLANLDTSRLDIGSLQEQLDDANLQMKLKEKDINKAEERINDFKELQRKHLKTIASLERKLKNSQFLILNYTEQIKFLKSNAEVINDLRKEITSLKQQIETMDGIQVILKATNSEAEELLKNESNPKKLSIWVTTLRRELRLCESKKSELRNVLKEVQGDLRKEIDTKKDHMDRILQLESENFDLREKLEAACKTAASTVSEDNNVNSNKTTLASAGNNVICNSNSNSPYLNIKSSSLGKVSLFGPPFGDKSMSDKNVNSSIKLTTLRIPSSGADTENKRKYSSAMLHKTTTADLSEKYTIFKKPRF